MEQVADQELRSNLMEVEARKFWLIITLKRPKTGRWSLPTTPISLYAKL